MTHHHSTTVILHPTYTSSVASNTLYELVDCGCTMMPTFRLADVSVPLLNALVELQSHEHQFMPELALELFHFLHCPLHALRKTVLTVDMAVVAVPGSVVVGSADGCRHGGQGTCQ